VFLPCPLFIYGDPYRARAELLNQRAPIKSVGEVVKTLLVSLNRSNAVLKPDLFCDGLVKLVGTLKPVQHRGEVHSDAGHFARPRVLI
jgi:hypothetical protein